MGTAEVFQVSCLKVSRTSQVVLGFDSTFNKRIIKNDFKRFFNIYFLYFIYFFIFFLIAFYF